MASIEALYTVPVRSEGYNEMLATISSANPGCGLPSMSTMTSVKLLKEPALP